MSLLLAISLTINILAIIYYIYQHKVKSTERVCEKKNEKNLYEQADDQQHGGGVVAMEHIEAYGEISKQIYYISS